MILLEFLVGHLWVVISCILMIFVIFQLLRQPGGSTKGKGEIKGKENDPDRVSFGQVSEMIEHERNRIASELHDELGTLLSVIHLDLELVLRESSQLTPYGEARLLEIRKNLNLVIESIRHNIWSVAPQMLDQVQLDFALRELCRKLDAYKGTHLHFVQSGIPFPLAHKQKLNLFRVVQELLTNAIKHSSAWNISVQLHWDDDTLTIIVEDDGSTYARVDERPSTGGMGTTNIIKRINLIGATMSREELSRGMKISITLKKSAVEGSSNGG
jgi:signal transduction histidine kinase